MTTIKSMLTGKSSAGANAVVAYVFTHPGESEKFYKQLGKDGFAAAVRTIPAEEWAAYPQLGPQQYKNVQAFAKKAPKSAAVILEYLAGSPVPGPAPGPTPSPSPAPQPGPAPVPGPSGLIHATNFLTANFKDATMRLLDPAVSDADCKSAVARLKAKGYTVAYVGFAMPDKSDARTRYIYTSSDKARVRNRIELVTSQGVAVIGWMHGGNFSELFGWSEDKFNQFQQLVHEDVGDMVLEYCQGIEVNESGWGPDRVGRHVDFLKRISGKRVGVHTGKPEEWNYALRADVFYVQYGFDRSTGEIASATQKVIVQLPGKRIIAAEYNLDGDSGTARAQGDAAIAAGAQGVGNGCTANGLAVLRSRMG